LFLRNVLTGPEERGYSPVPTVRFSKLLEESGKPHPITPWGDAHHNQSFMKAVKEHRVVTLKQETTAKAKDFGKVGFLQEPYVSHLVFPKPLKAEPDVHVVSLKYDLLEEPQVRDPVTPADLTPRPKKEPKYKPPAREQPQIEPAPQEPEESETPNPEPPKPEPPKPKPEPALKDFSALVRRIAIVETTVQVRARNKKEAKEQAREAGEQEPFDASRR
jgi:hypothetical protein